jgi:hypothetical protein
VKRERISNQEVLTWCNRRGITSIGRKSEIDIVRAVMEAKDIEYAHRSQARRRELDSCKRDLDLIYGERV